MNNTKEILSVKIYDPAVQVSISLKNLRHWQIAKISWSVWPWQAFWTLPNILGYGQDPAITVAV